MDPTIRILVISEETVNYRGVAAAAIVKMGYQSSTGNAFLTL